LVVARVSQTRDGLPATSSRRRVILGAYACGVDEGPEAAAGWAFAVAAAQSYDVTVITRTRFRAVVEDLIRADDTLAKHLHPVFIDLPAPAMRARLRLPGGLYWYYPLWQRKLLKTARRLHAQTPFEIAHHVTFANDWMPCGLSRLNDVRFIWGPVGGASRVPWWRLREWLGVRGVLTEAIRGLMTSIPRAMWGDSSARRASVVVAQNPAVAHRFRKARRVVTEPNAALDQNELPERLEHRSEAPVAIFAGRLVAWKGAQLAVAAIARPETSTWRLNIIGDGYSRKTIEKQAERLGVADRVTFSGHVPREEVLQAFARADALLFPSLHDQAGWVVAEASALGLPIVCLPLGGPATLADRNAFVASTEGDVVGNLAAQLVAARSAQPQAHDRWSHQRLPELVRDWYDGV